MNIMITKNYQRFQFHNGNHCWWRLKIKKKKNKFEEEKKSISDLVSKKK